MDQEYFWQDDEQFERLEPRLPTDTRGKPRVDDRRLAPIGWPSDRGDASGVPTSQTAGLINSSAVARPPAGARGRTNFRPYGRRGRHGDREHRIFRRPGTDGAADLVRAEEGKEPLLEPFVPAC